MAFKPFEKAPAKGKVPAKPNPFAKGGVDKAAKPKPFAKGGAVKKGSRGC